MNSIANNEYGWVIASLWYTTAVFAAVYPCVTHLSDTYGKENQTVVLLRNINIPIGTLFLIADAGFGLSCFVFLQLAKAYGEQVYAPQAPRYPGAFQQRMDGTSLKKYPSGFLRYLPFAFSLTFLLPILVGLYLVFILGEVQVFLQSLAGYLIVFSIQIVMETNIFNRNQMTSSVPFSFGLYRFWQIVRGLVMCTLSASRDAQGACRISQACLLMLLAFWIFDHAVTSTLLPWMLNVQCIETRAKSH
ncbi:hypothetical protein PSENEW3n2_00005151 [Picochlorum sp. SENEW3]|nr:hypothetical protein PSENEW3n2_00005151 [Picochlorum sp. SENEW3]WPT17146.1 hypothetical protein PSENEW3_00005151 [Picochlorum sp. SENEW3]